MALIRYSKAIFFLMIFAFYYNPSQGTYYAENNEVGLKALNVMVSVSPEIFTLLDKKVSKIQIVLKHVNYENQGEITTKSPLVFDYPFVKDFIKQGALTDKSDHLNPHIMDKLNQTIELTPESINAKKILIFNDVHLSFPFKVYAYLLIQFQDQDLIKSQIESRQGYYSDLSFFLDEIFEQYEIVLIPEVFALEIQPSADNLVFQLLHNTNKSVASGARLNVFSNSFLLFVQP